MARFFLQPGFRFYPTDIELVKYYLKRKVMRKPFRIDAISEIDIYKFAPWDLPGKSCLQNGDREWYFFCSRDRKYANGRRINRATGIGYWKTTGNDRHICHNSQTVGIKKTLIFYVGRAPRGDRTDWVMHEYRLEDKKLDEMGVMQDAFVLCKIFEKSGLGPKNGEQHGALFEEEDWDDDMLKNPADPIPNSDFGSPFLVPANEQNISPLVPANEQNISPIMGTVVPGTVSVSSSEPIPCLITSSHASGGLPSLPEDDDIASLLAIFDNNVNSSFYSENSGPIGFNRSAIEAPPLVDGNDIYNGLEDLSARADLTTIDGIHLPTILEVEYPLDQTLLGADSYFMELDDLNRPLQHPVELNGYDCISFDSQCSGYTSYDNFGGAGKSVIPLGGPGDSVSRSVLSDGSDIFQNQFSVPPHDTNCGYETVELTVNDPVVEEIEEREGSIFDSQTLTRRGSFHHHW